LGRRAHSAAFGGSGQGAAFGGRAQRAAFGGSGQGAAFGARSQDAAFGGRAQFRLAAAFAAGAALNLAFAPLAWWPLGVLAPAALFALIRGVPPRTAALLGAAFGVGLFTFGTYWLFISLHVFGLVPLWLTLVLQTLLVAALSAYPAALGYVANRCYPEPGVARDWLALPALWVLLEWFRGWGVTGFPWLSLGYAFIDNPLAGWAPLLGVYGVTSAAVLAAAGVNGALARKVGAGNAGVGHAGVGNAGAGNAGAGNAGAGNVGAGNAGVGNAGAGNAGAGNTAARHAAARHEAAPRRVLGLAVVAAALFGAPALAAHWPWTRPVGGAIPVAAVQGAVPQDRKWQYDNQDATMARYLNLTKRAWGARLIVWPESALPVLAGDIPDYLDDLRSAGRAHGADFAIGLVNYAPATKQYFNGLLVLSDAGGWYYKRHLVPFGEYFPVPSFIRSWMRLLSLPYDDISAGSEHQPVLHAAGQALGLTICYEDAFGSSQLDILREATLLINVTNNAWFGDSTAPHQHLQISRMRALEAGRFLIRATNDGVTAIMGPHGEIVGRLPQFQEAVLRAAVQPMTGLTPYARFGNYPVVLGAIGLLAVGAWRQRDGRTAPPGYRLGVS
jgi:apolipoprotein N-acyltransferase